MIKISSVIQNRDIKIGGAQKKIFEWSYYGDLACKSLVLSPPGRGRLMAYFKGKANAYNLHKLAVDLSRSHHLPADEEQRLRYFFGAAKRI